MSATDLDPMTEDELLRAVVDAARLTGWMCHHDRRSDRAIQQGDTGFPDLVLAKGGRVIFAELKRERTHPTTQQMAWHLALRGQQQERMPGAPLVAVWRPSDLDDIIDTLTGRRAW